MSIRNLFYGDNNPSIMIYTNHLNVGNVDIFQDNIKYVKSFESKKADIDELFIKEMNVYDKINNLDNKLLILENQTLNDRLILLENKTNELINTINILVETNIQNID